jgi:hypothetical protein
MRITEDFSYLSDTDKKAIKNGIAKLCVYGLKIDRFFTEEEMQENRKQAEALSRDEWGKRCDKMADFIAEQNKIAIDELAKVFNIGQYNYNHKYDMGDFWFWAGEKLDYITLSTNEDDGTEKRNEKAGKALEILKTIDTANNIVRIHYTAVYDEEKLTEAVEDFAKSVDGKFINYNCMVGKLFKDMYNRYIFKKKGARKYGYELSKKQVYGIIND